MSNDSLITVARTILAALPRRPDGLLITSDADVPSVAALVALFRESGMGQRQWCAAIGLGATTLGQYITGRRGKGVHWPALTAALGLEPYQKPAPVMTRHAVVCREYRLRKKVRTQAQRVPQEVTHVAA